jgi:hypothetical protein
VLIEAKFRSSKSSWADNSSLVPTDQLAREWDNLRVVARARGARPFLIFLTPDGCCPVEDLASSLDELREKRRDLPDVPQILWLSWRSLNRLPLHEDAVLRDLQLLLSRLDLTLFQGVRLSPLPRLAWSFAWRPRMHR